MPTAAPALDEHALLPQPIAPGRSNTLVLPRRGGSRVRLTGMFFDLGKAFLLPSALHGIRSLRGIYDEHPGAAVLVVGHTDSSGSAEFNRALSLQRARAVAAYLMDEVPSWLDFYGLGVPASARWGAHEDRLMLSELPAGSDEPYLRGGIDYEQAVRAFQEDEGLDVDGDAGPITREALITRYMAIDKTSLPAGTVIMAHGCGEHFPVTDLGDGVVHDLNRRVEIFVFDHGIRPHPSSETSTGSSAEYPRWVRAVTRTVRVDSEDDSPPGRIHLRLLDELGDEPLRELAVAVIGEGFRLEGESDENGVFDGGEVPLGRYQLLLGDGAVPVPAIDPFEEPYPIHVNSDLFAEFRDAPGDSAEDEELFAQGAFDDDELEELAEEELEDAVPVAG